MHVIEGLHWGFVKDLCEMRLTQIGMVTTYQSTYILQNSKIALKLCSKS